MGDTATAAAIAALVAAQEQQRRIRLNLHHKRKLKGVVRMHETVRQFIGKTCTIGNPIGFSSTGKVVSVEDNWLKLDTGKKVELINLDYVVSITNKADKG